MKRLRVKRPNAVKEVFMMMFDDLNEGNGS